MSDVNHNNTVLFCSTLCPGEGPPPFRSELTFTLPKQVFDDEPGVGGAFRRRMQRHCETPPQHIAQSLLLWLPRIDSPRCGRDAHSDFHSFSLSIGRFRLLSVCMFNVRLYVHDEPLV